jgi:DNA-3-methyladenine glycosylase
MTASPSTARNIASLAPLPREFYSRDPRLVARDLLGKLLIRRENSGGPHPPSFGECGADGELGADTTLIAGRIVEAEAYLGRLDPAAHAYRGLTPRTAVLFGPPGHAYIYFIYGNHHCANVSCQPNGEAVLFRALEPVCGLAEMAALRGLKDSAPTPKQRVTYLRQLTSGPGRLCQALAITRQRDNGCDLCSPASSLYIADDGSPAGPISATPRINVPRAPLDKWRFILTGNPFVSGKRRP